MHVLFIRSVNVVLIHDLRVLLLRNVRVVFLHTVRVVSVHSVCALFIHSVDMVILALSLHTKRKNNLIPETTSFSRELTLSLRSSSFSGDLTLSPKSETLEVSILRRTGPFSRELFLLPEKNLFSWIGWVRAAGVRRRG